MLLAVEAHRLRDDADTRSTVLAAVEEHPQLLGLLQGTESGLEAAIFSPDGKLLATPTSDGSGTLLWDVATRERIAVLRHGRRRMLGGAISPDGRWLVLPAIREEDGTPIGVLQVWDLRSRRFVRETRSPGGALSSAAFSRDGRVLVTQGGPRVGGPFPTIAIVWDTATWEPRGKPWALIDEYVGDRRIALSGDGRLIASPTPAGGVKVFDVGTRTQVGKEIPAAKRAGGLATEVTALAFNPDASVLAIGTDVGPILLVDPSTGRSLATLSQEAYSTSLEWSRDGRLLASGRNDGRTQFFDRKGTPVGLQLAANASEVNDVSFSDDGRRFATAGVDRTGAIWALDGSRTIGKPLRGRNAGITQAAWIDEQQFVTAETDGGIVFRDAAGVPSRRTRVRGEALTVAVDTKRRSHRRRRNRRGDDTRARWRAGVASRPRRWMGAQRGSRSGHGLRRGWRGQHARQLRRGDRRPGPRARLGSVHRRGDRVAHPDRTGRDPGRGRVGTRRERPGRLDRRQLPHVP